MPKWKGRCIRFKPPGDASYWEICLPSPSSLRNTLDILTSPFRNLYFWIWLLYSFSLNDFQRLDNINIPPPFAQIYSFIIGSTELAEAIRSHITSVISRSSALSWVFLLFGPELLPGGFYELFESLQYYDDWIEAYRLFKLLVPELWRLLKRLTYTCLQLVSLIPKAIFVVLIIFPFTSFNFIVVRSLSPLLAGLFDREFEGNFRVWETHIIEPLICFYISRTLTTRMAVISGKTTRADLYTYEERRSNVGTPWAFFIWVFIALFSSFILMITILFAWDISYFALPWCLFSISYYFRGSRKRRALTGALAQPSVEKEHIWALGWTYGYREGQIQYRRMLFQICGEKEPEDDGYGGEYQVGDKDYYLDDSHEYNNKGSQYNDFGDYQNYENGGYEADDSVYYAQNLTDAYKTRGNGRTNKPAIPNPESPKGETITGAALARKDRGRWENDRTGE
ncbi:hypothetical protein TWF730_006822 [Orbilia blumenaviensis]|uniref:Uncharacterized protein n=1 Tax=Orbilia blumenaviensis TaxID=1796055 RepID=A0AAV9VFE4_9PEZI